MMNPEVAFVPKPGVKTSEFAVAIAAILVGFLHKKFGIDLDPGTVALVVGAVVAYLLSRGLAKLNSSAPSVVPKIVVPPTPPTETANKSTETEPPSGDPASIIPGSEAAPAPGSEVPPPPQV